METQTPTFGFSTVARGSPETLMEQAQEWLRLRKISHEKKTPYQIKIGLDVSYYPSTGRIFIDGAEKAEPGRGFEALIAVMRRLRLIR